jgi:hypothetical protein
MRPLGKPAALCMPIREATLVEIVGGGVSEIVTVMLIERHGSCFGHGDGDGILMHRFPNCGILCRG